MRNRGGPGWVFFPALIIAVILALFVVSPASALEECPDPARPHHWMPFCLTEAEFAALTAPSPPPVAPTPVSVSPESLVRTIAYYFWPDWAAERMIRIARCESGFVATARNPSSNTRGIWQVDDIWQVPWPGNYYDPWTNGAVAYQVWLEQGWGAWACKG